MYLITFAEIFFSPFNLSDVNLILDLYEQPSGVRRFLLSSMPYYHHVGSFDQQSLYGNISSNILI